MIWIPNENTDPAFNLAAEEVILSSLNIKEETLFFYINEPSIIIGRHQNTREEINAEFVGEQRIRIVRRLSGGGAVYHDFGNLCYSFIYPFPDRLTPDFALFTAPIVQALQNLGVPAELSGRNDILVAGAKISGNAYYHNRFGSVCHGTLLFDSDMGMLERALRPKPEKIERKGVRSVRSRVTNLKDYLPDIKDVKELRQAILYSISRTQPDFKEFRLAENDILKIESLAESRYRSDRWNFGKSPKYNYRVCRQFSFGEVDARLWVEDNRIREIRFFGDFFSSEDPDSFSEKLIGIPFESQAIAQVAQQSDIEKLFPGISAVEFADFLTGKRS